jgi:murein tripeptide amidase MpaA
LTRFSVSRLDISAAVSDEAGWTTKKKENSMKSRNIWTLLIMIMACFPTVGLAREKMVIRFESPDAEVTDRYLSSEADVAAFKPGQYLDVVVTSQEYEQLLTQDRKFRVIQTESTQKSNLKVAGYRNYAEITAELQALAQKYPLLCRIIDIGDSQGKIYSDAGKYNYDAMKHDIWAVKVSNHVDTTEDEPAVYFMGGHHAREPIGVEVTMAILNYFLDHYESDETVRQYLNNTEIWFVPLVNPDGHQVVLDEIDVWWRKNIRDNNENDRYDRRLISHNGYGVDGVDLNRNYNFEWGVSDTSPFPRSLIYGGPAGGSEPEVQAVQSLMEYRKFIAGISYHSYGELVLYPYGYATDAYAPDSNAMSALAADMAKSIPGIAGGNYLFEPGWALYPCSGTTDDFSYGNYGTFAYTIELATQFIPPADQVQQICQDNLQGALVVMDRLNRAMLTGHVTDDTAGLPITAEVFIKGIDDSPIYRTPYTSEPLFGRYYRLLLPGTYQVTFSKTGYVSVSYDTIVINPDNPTLLDIKLQQI